MTEGRGDEAVGDGSSDLTLAEVLAESAAGLAGVTARTVGDETSWAAGPAVFATLAGERAEFRLDPLIAAAALRTPDTSASPRGPDWITFAPAILDDHGVDRAEAWFLSAHRRAAASRRG
jgi:hypothetical protein